MGKMLKSCHAEKLKSEIRGYAAKQKLGKQSKANQKVESRNTDILAC
jgi:hypothetical protein